MSRIQSLAITTSKNQLNTYGMNAITGFSVAETTPEGTATRYLVKTGKAGTWQRYDTESGAWTDATTQELTPASVMEEGMTAAELAAVPSSSLAAFMNTTVDVAAGLMTTNDSQPTLTSFDIVGETSGIGQYLTDGTVTWILEDTFQGDAVGDISFHPTLLPGHVLANGAAVKASEYPRLLQWVQDNDMTGDDDAHYAYDADADTLKLPNAIGRVLQGAASVATKSAGLPNITGSARWKYMGYTAWPKGYSEAANTPEFSGAFDVNKDATPIMGSVSSGEASRWGYPITFDASKSNAIYGASDTVQPPAITLLAQIKY